jgi:hypothetical protein
MYPQATCARKPGTDFIQSPMKVAPARTGFGQRQRKNDESDPPAAGWPCAAAKIAKNIFVKANDGIRGIKDDPKPIDPSRAARPSNRQWRLRSEDIAARRFFIFGRRANKGIP